MTWHELTIGALARRAWRLEGDVLVASMRGRRVLISAHVAFGRRVVRLESMICGENQRSAHEASCAMAELEVGGLVLKDGRLLLRHTLDLAAATAENIESAIMQVAAEAARLEPPPPPRAANPMWFYVD